MEDLEYGIGRVVPAAYDEVLPRVKDALNDEGFGVLTEIDVQATLRARLGVERGKYAILGACNPPHAHRALQAEPELGLLLPCNVVVYETEGGTRVSAINAGAMLGIVGNPALDEIATDVQARLERVIAAV
jgi:uncharacterized protein (DUF302 family)